MIPVISIAKFSHPRVLLAPAEVVPLELGVGARSQKSKMMGYQRIEKALR